MTDSRVWRLLNDRDPLTGRKLKEDEVGIDLEKYVGSKWIKGTDIEGKVLDVSIRAVTEELIHDQQSNKEKLVLAIWFNEGKKALIPAKTNLEDIIIPALGTNTDTWVGVKGQLYTERTSFGPGARFRPNEDRRKNAAPAQGKTPPWERERQDDGDLAEFSNESLSESGDDLPF